MIFDTKKPHTIFISLIVMFIVAVLLLGNEIIDININDTMFVISLYSLSVIIGGVFAIISLCYWLAGKLGLHLPYGLILLHILLTSGFLIGFFYGLRFNNTHGLDMMHRNKIMMLSAFVLIIGVFIFLLNIIIGIGRKFLYANN